MAFGYFSLNCVIWSKWVIGDFGGIYSAETEDWNVNAVNFFVLMYSYNQSTEKYYSCKGLIKIHFK